jgi:polyphenol oxidase
MITPHWPAHARVRASMSTRAGGSSVGAYDSMNLGYSTADDRATVAANETHVASLLGITTPAIRWVYQVHGNVVHHSEKLPINEPLGATSIAGDAIVSHTPGLVCAVKVADCMPVLFAADDASVVAAAHAGWRGLSSGVLENTVAACNVSASKLVAWLGPCIGPSMFEVGEDVRAAFVLGDDEASAAFKPRGASGKFLCDLPMLATMRLRRVGVEIIAASELCTMTDSKQFFSHRRDPVTGRMAVFVWIEP